MASFTKKAIMESFIKLLNQKPISKITVKEIVDDCGINRNSFYYHFVDIPALVEEILQSEAEKIIQGKGSNESLEECLIMAVDFAKNNKQAVLNLYNSGNREAYELYLNRIVYHIVNQYITKAASDIPVKPEDMELFVSFYKNIFVGIILDWMNDGMRHDIMEPGRRLMQLYDGSSKRAFLRSAGIEEN
jgi:AcrR family transcriptional regulator